MNSLDIAFHFLEHAIINSISIFAQEFLSNYSQVGLNKTKLLNKSFAWYEITPGIRNPRTEKLVRGEIFEKADWADGDQESFKTSEPDRTRTKNVFRMTDRRCPWIPARELQTDKSKLKNCVIIMLNDQNCRKISEST